MKKLIALLFVLPAVAHAEPPAQIAELAPLIGKWSGSGTLTAGGESHAIAGTYTCEKAAVGLGLRCSAEFTGIPGMDLYKTEDLWGWSAGDGLFHWFTVTNAGEVHDHAGSVKDGHIFVQFVGPQGGQIFTERVTFDIVAGKKLTLQCDVSVGGVAAESISMTMTPAKR